MAAIQQMRNFVLPAGQVIASLYLFKRTIDFALTPLRKVADEIAKAAEAAQRLYSQAASSGMGIGMTAKRNAFAQVLGISEQDIFAFGQAIAVLDYQLKQVVETTRKVNPGLSTVNMEF